MICGSAGGQTDISAPMRSVLEALQAQGACAELAVGPGAHEANGMHTDWGLEPETRKQPNAPKPTELDEESFQRCLLQLAEPNDVCAAARAPAPVASSTGEHDLENDLKDLMAALRKERPPPPPVSFASIVGPSSSDACGDRQRAQGDSDPGNSVRPSADAIRGSCDDQTACKQAALQPNQLDEDAFGRCLLRLAEQNDTCASIAAVVDARVCNLDDELQGLMHALHKKRPGPPLESCGATSASTAASVACTREETRSPGDVSIDVAITPTPSSGTAHVCEKPDILASMKGVLAALQKEGLSQGAVGGANGKLLLEEKDVLETSRSSQ